jgi:hypothetical protein
LDQAKAVTVLTVLGSVRVMCSKSCDGEPFSLAVSYSLCSILSSPFCHSVYIAQVINGCNIDTNVCHVECQGQITSVAVVNNIRDLQT